MMRALATAALLALLGCGAVLPSYRDQDVPISSIAAFDPMRYQGLWYEVARFPAPFQAGCMNTTAEYALTANGMVAIRNTCLRDGNVSEIEGVGEVSGPGRLSIRLDGVPFEADYWVLWVDEGYRTAVVGSPSGRSGWILNRDPQIPADRLQAAREVLAFNGYDLSFLTMTPQAGI